MNYKLNEFARRQIGFVHEPEKHELDCPPAKEKTGRLGAGTIPPPCNKQPATTSNQHLSFTHHARKFWVGSQNKHHLLFFQIFENCR